MTTDDNLDAPLWGAAAIAQEIESSIPTTYQLIYRKQLPVRRVGGRWCTTRRRLRAFFNGTEEAVA